jgi:phage gp46-like protein
MDTLIDPITRDYVLLQGALKRDPANGLLNACYLRLTVQLGSYWEDAAFGSKLHLLSREKDVSRVAVLAKQYAEQALAPILIDGRAKQIDVSTSRSGTGILYLLIKVISAAGEAITFKHPVSVG